MKLKPHVPATHPSGREAFLMARQNGIGGSDIGAILGVNPFKTAVEVFLDKTTPHPVETPTEWTYWGNAVEPVILKRFSEDHGIEVIRPTTMARHAEHNWMVGHVDGLIPGESPGILEAKNVNAFGAQAWGDEGSDKVPLTYVAQVAWYMAIQDVDYAIIAVLFGGNTYREFRVERDKELEQTLIQKGQEFWGGHVLTGTPPKPQTPEDAKRLFKRDDGTAVDADEDLLKCYEQLKSTKAQAQRLDKEMAELETVLKAKMRHAAQLTYQDQTLATWKTQTSRRFDSPTFKKNYPELYEQFTQVNETRVFRLK